MFDTFKKKVGPYDPLPRLYKVGQRNEHCGVVTNTTFSINPETGKKTNLRTECCAGLIAEQKAAKTKNNISAAIDCDYRGKPEGPGFHWVNVFAYDVKEWFIYLTKSWKIATQNSINFSQNKAAS